MRWIRNLSWSTQTGLGVLLAGVLVVGGLNVFEGGSNPGQKVEVLGARLKAPSVPTITSGPSGHTNSTSATFAFKSTPTPAGYQCKLDGGSFSTCTSTKTYGALTAGLHTFSVEALDGGFTSSPAVRTWTVDLTVPTAPTISSGPENPTIATTAHFVFVPAEEGVTFECRLDGDAKSCVSPFDYKRISDGDHIFSVVAIDGAGNHSPAATWSWTVLINKAFGISGDAIGPLLPGLDATPLNLKISNPYNFAIRVLTVDVTVESSTAHDCDVEDSFEQTTQPFTLTTELVISANSEVHLRSLHPDDWPADWPAIAMWDNPNVNQDACQDAAFNLTYTGTAQKS